jgi:tetratricopeptide (TPR) repeat protein
MRTFRRLLDLDPSNGLAWENIGVMELQAKNAGAAEAALSRAVELDPGLSGAHTALGVVYAGTGRTGQAIDAWKRAVDIDEGAFDALYNLTINLAAVGRRDEARQYGERYLALAPPALREDAAAIRKVLDGIR